LGKSPLPRINTDFFPHFHIGKNLKKRSAPAWIQHFRNLLHRFREGPLWTPRQAVDCAPFIFHEKQIDSAWEERKFTIVL